MRTIIAGSRHITNRAYLYSAIQSCPWANEITSVVCGGAQGVDLLGDQWAKDAGLPVFYYLVEEASAYRWGQLQNLESAYGGGYINALVVADWVYEGPKAGPMRNAAMAENADALIVVPLAGDRKGSDSMIRAATKRGLRIHEWEVGNGSHTLLSH